MGNKMAKSISLSIRNFLVLQWKIDRDIYVYCLRNTSFFFYHYYAHLCRQIALVRTHYTIQNPALIDSTLISNIARDKIMRERERERERES